MSFLHPFQGPLRLAPQSFTYNLKLRDWRRIEVENFDAFIYFTWFLDFSLFPSFYKFPNIVGKVNQFISRSSVTATGALSSTCTVNSQITGGYLLNRGAYSVGLVTGAFSVETLGYTGPAPLQDLAGDINITFNASRVSTLFGAASTIQTASLRSLALIRAY